MDLLLGLVKDVAGVGVDQDVFALGSDRLVEIGLAVELGVGRHRVSEDCNCLKWDDKVLREIEERMQG